MDEFKPTIYVSGKENKLNSLLYEFFSDTTVDSCKFVQKYASPTASEKTKVLEVVLKDYRKTSFLVRRVLKAGRYLHYRIHNYDLKLSQIYLYKRGLFPLAFVEVEVDIETGKADLIRVVNATDVGKIIDPQGIEGQLNGCLGSGGIDSAKGLL